MARNSRKKQPALDLRVLHPEVRAKVLELAKGDRGRIEVVSRNEAVVH